MYQSAYRHHHSTETALLKVVNDILLNMDKQRVTLLLLLDLSAAFDTVDHNTLLRRLQNSFGIQGKVLSWLKSYLSGRSQCISVNGSLSRIFSLECGVPQGSCLGPLLFTLYTSRLFDIIQTHLPEVHCFADDTQLYLSFSPSSAINQLSAISAMESCVDDIRSWMLTDSLKLNDDKSEFLIIGTPRQLAKIDIGSIRVGDCNVSTATSARNLCSWFDSKLSMSTHITKLSSSSFYYLYNIRRIRKYLSRRCTETLHAFITARIDYCNSLLFGLPDYRINKLQRIQNAAARLICQQSRFCHITPLLFDLHWLPVKFRIEFKILLITFKALKGLSPTYIDSLISIKSTSRYDLRSSNDSLLLSYPKPLSKATLGDRSFTYATPKLWNALP